MLFLIKIMKNQSDMGQHPDI
ncbi:hypothetical protein AERO9A_320057 [Aeromonas salmonicida]|nr:hypothetical protein AERO9A_320057 [Aeromonas salmonicida]